jgi:hypothetical protein
VHGLGPVAAVSYDLIKILPILEGTKSHLVKNNF